MARAFADEVRVIAVQYPESRSAVMPALRIAQERHGGWLPPEALEEVAEALDLTPAYCKGVATFYDMFHLEPVGRRLVEVCTNICCGLRGAQDVLAAFESELDRKSTRLNSSHSQISYAVFCLKKKKDLTSHLLQLALRLIYPHRVCEC